MLALWAIAESFADRAHGIDSTQLCCGSNVADSFIRAASEVKLEESENTERFNHMVAAEQAGKSTA